MKKFRILPPLFIVIAVIIYTWIITLVNNTFNSKISNKVSTRLDSNVVENNYDDVVDVDVDDDDGDTDDYNDDTDGISEVSSIEYRTEKDSKCKRTFEWSMIDSWRERHDLPDEIDYNALPQKLSLDLPRMGGPSAKGTFSMYIQVNNKNVSNITVVDVRSVVKLNEDNLWHRMVPQYSAWSALQVAQKRYGLYSDRTIFLCSCLGSNSRNDLQYLPAEWEKIGETSCDTSLLSTADVRIIPPKDGLLWDLAWDFNFTCHNSDMFKTFASLFVNKSKIEPMVGCFISRQERPIRSVVNYAETLDMMRTVFPRVRVIALTKKYSNDETIDLLYECKVLFGAHGAGHMNSIFARPGVAVVEMVGSANPAYFRNVNMLLGQHYESIKGDRKHGMNERFVVDLDEAKEALERAKDYVNTWLDEHDGQWRRRK